MVERELWYYLVHGFLVCDSGRVCDSVRVERCVCDSERVCDSVRVERCVCVCDSVRVERCVCVIVRGCVIV